MMKEFCHVAKVDEEGIAGRWVDATQRLFKYAGSEEKKSVKNLLDRYHALEEPINEGEIHVHVYKYTYTCIYCIVLGVFACTCEFLYILFLDRSTAYAMYIMSAILNRKKKKSDLLIVFEVHAYYVYMCKYHFFPLVLKGESISVDEAITSIEVKSPCIIAFGTTLDSVGEAKVVMEGDNVLHMPTLLTALHYCMASYYVFNISYPVEFRPFMLFLEKYIYGMKPSLKLPLSVTLLYDNLQKV